MLTQDTTVLQVYFTLVFVAILLHCYKQDEVIISDKIHHTIVNDAVECMAYHHLNAVKLLACTVGRALIASIY